MAIRLLTTVIALIFTVTAEAQSQQTPVALQRAIAAYGAAIAADDTLNAVAQGTVTLFSISGPKNAYNVTIIRKGPGKIQRIIKQSGGELRQGSDGNRDWFSLHGIFFSTAPGQVLDFIESQTVRSVPTLFISQALSQGITLRDLGKQGGASVIESEDAVGRKTSYFIDDKTSLVTRLEFQTGRAADIAGRPIPRIEAYVFSDFRSIQGRMTPFKIERYTGGIKMEEMQFSSVSYAATVPDDTFLP